VGLSEIEAAQVLGISTGAVKSQLHAAGRELAQALRDLGLAPATRTAASTKGIT
jgi:DNA-directed RNA polymerase specialized sigma24 family protein